MRILIINDFGYEIGGTETYIFSLKKALQSKGHEVRVFTSDYSENTQIMADYTFRSANPNSIFRVLPYILNIKAYIRLKNVLKEFNPDVIQLNNIFYKNSSSILIALRKIPTVLIIHDLKIVCPVTVQMHSKGAACSKIFGKKCITCLGRSRYIIELINYALIKTLIRNINLIVANSSYSLSNVQKFIKKCKTNKLKYGVKIFKFKPISNYHNILYCGRISKEKGIEYALLALPKILCKNPHTCLTIVGDGPQKPFLQELANKLGIDTSVKFISQVPHHLIRKYYEDATIVIVPSIWPEPFGKIGLEAMSIGRPVIASNVGGIPEWCIDGITGYLVKSKDSDAIAEKAIKLLSNKKLLIKMSKAARLKAEEFSIENHVNNLENIFFELIKKNKERDQ